MDKHTEESPKQSIQKDDAEETSPTEPRSFIEDSDSHVTKDDIHLSASGSSKEYQDADVSAGLVSTVVHQDEAEFKDVEGTDLSKDEENSQSVQKLETKTSKDNASSKMGSSKSLNPEMGSGSSAEVDVPTHQASETSISTSNTISNSLAQSSEPIAIPSTSRDTSGLAPEDSSPKRPTHFGPNVKQAVHVFHPRNPASILQRFPVPYHSGRWVYLRDSPESSDYGGSPDSLEDLFLMEALDINTPENEMEDSDTPHFEEAPLCSPSLLNPVGIDSPSESGQVEGTIQDESSESGHIKTTIEDESSESGHIKTTIEDESSESGHIKKNIGDLPSDSKNIERTIAGLPFEREHIDVSIGDETPETDHIDEITGHLPSELGYNEILVEDLPSESGHTERTLRDLPSQIKGNVGSEPFELGHSVGIIEDEQPESGHIQRTDEDLSSESAIIEGRLENAPTEERQREDVGSIIRLDSVESRIGELQYESGPIEEGLVDLHPELLQGEYNVGALPHESGYSERSSEDLVSDSE